MPNVASRRIWMWRLGKGVNRSHIHPLRLYSQAPEDPAPPLLAKMKADLKAAMKAKDTNRLGVLRGILSEVTNASKSPKPVKTDMDLRSLIKKREAPLRAAVADFAAAKREDLMGKGNEQLQIMDEYSSAVEIVREDEMMEAIAAAIARLKNEGKEAKLPDVLKHLIGPNGSLTGRLVDKGSLATLVKSALSSEN